MIDFANSCITKVGHKELPKNNRIAGSCIQNGVIIIKLIRIKKICIIAF